MASSNWSELTRRLDDDDLEKLTAFRRFCRGLPGVKERISTSQVAFARERGFTSGYIKSHYLELGIELLREVTDPKPRTTFATSKTVIMHRYSLRRLQQFDDAIRALIREASETVGPGARTRRSAD